MIECNQCDEIVSHHHYLKFDDVIYYFCENCYFEYMDESEWPEVHPRDYLGKVAITDTKNLVLSTKRLMRRFLKRKKGRMTTLKKREGIRVATRCCLYTFRLYFILNFCAISFSNLGFSATLSQNSDTIFPFSSSLNFLALRKSSKLCSGGNLKVPFLFLAIALA